MGTSGVLVQDGPVGGGLASGFSGKWFASSTKAIHGSSSFPSYQLHLE